MRTHGRGRVHSLPKTVGPCISDSVVQSPPNAFLLGTPSRDGRPPSARRTMAGGLGYKGNDTPADRRMRHEIPGFFGGTSTSRSWCASAMSDKRWGPVGAETKKRHSRNRGPACGTTMTLWRNCSTPHSCYGKGGGAGEGRPKRMTIVQSTRSMTEGKTRGLKPKPWKEKARPLMSEASGLGPTRGPRTPTPSKGLPWLWPSLTRRQDLGVGGGGGAYGPSKCVGWYFWDPDIIYTSDIVYKGGGGQRGFEAPTHPR